MPERLALGLAWAVALAGCRGEPSGEELGGESSETAETAALGTGTDSESETGAATSETDTGTGETDTGEPGFCGDGVVDEGEACDDGNEADDDGCTAACELGPCGFEWLTRELVLDGGEFEASAPALLDGPDIVVAHQLGAGGQSTGIVRAPRADGVVYAAAEIDLASDDPTPSAIAIAPAGDLFLASADAPVSAVSVRRLSPAGDELWAVSRAAHNIVADLAYGPGDELILVSTVDDGPMNVDVELAGLDPADGAELWSHRFGGPPAQNGFSTDRGAALVVDAQGRAFVAYDEYRAWDTLAPVVVAFGPGGASEPLWQTAVLEIPGRQLEITDMALGPSGTLALSFMRFDGSQIFWLAALDAETGALEWVVTRDDFALPDKLSTVRGVAVSEDRVLATGSWIADLDGLDVRQGYALALDLDGARVCLGTLDDYDAASNSTGETWLPLTALRDPDSAGFYLAGYVNDFGQAGGAVDLMLARVR